MNKLILVRHGETDKNVNNKLHESGDLELLNEKGKSQIEKTANELKLVGIDVVYHSLEARAVQSAKIISDLCGVSSIPLKGLQERNWGIYSNKPWSEVSKVLEGFSLEERYLYVPENGESWKSFETRLNTVIKNIVKNNEFQNVAIVTHGGSIRALMPYLLGVPKEESFKYDPHNASITMFKYKQDKFKALKIDNISHLN